MDPRQRLADNPALEFLRSRIDYERTSQVPYGQRDFRLDRMRELLRRLGNPQNALKIVHVAGTKGKGSTAASLASILVAGNYRTGLYTSPHLDRVEERLMIDGAICPSDELIEHVARLQTVVEAMDALSPEDEASSGRPTYFEIITALALVRFAEWRVDAAVLEVGLGGRLDSTNVCRPQVSVITSISYDHTQQLGNTLAAIAREKAGIIKPGRPVVSGETAAEPRDVIAAVARQNNSRLIELGRDFEFDYEPPRHLERADTWPRLDFRETHADSPVALDDLSLRLAGRHQAANAAVALATALELRRQGWHLSDDVMRRGLAEVRWPARVEILQRRPTVVLDSAHNVASIEALVRVLEESFTVRRRILVFATTRDKDVKGMLRVLLPAFDEVICTRYHSNPRGMPAQELAELAAAHGARGMHLCPDPPTAWRLAATLAGADDMICISGSFFIAAEMRAAREAGDSTPEQ